MRAGAKRGSTWHRATQKTGPRSFRAFNAAWEPSMLAQIWENASPRGGRCTHSICSSTQTRCIFWMKLQTSYYRVITVFLPPPQPINHGHWCNFQALGLCQTLPKGLFECLLFLNSKNTDSLRTLRGLCTLGNACKYVIATLSSSFFSTPGTWASCCAPTENTTKGRQGIKKAARWQFTF